MSDGAIVTVDRVATIYQYRHIPNPGTDYKQTLSIGHPTTNVRITWEGDFNLEPVLFNIYGGQAYIGFTSSRCDTDLRAYGDPNPPFVVLVFTDSGRWVQVNLSQLPDAVRRVNLIPDPESANRVKQDKILLGTYTGLLLVQDVEKRNQRVWASNSIESGFIPSLIPTDFASWNFAYKKADGYKCS
jgi:hypothetical protein